jgi:misacylated tRNA(Ala) deacylase
VSRYFCHDHPDVLALETRVLDARPGAVVLEQSPFHPGGGGQLADRGRIAWHGGETRVVGSEAADGRVWHRLADAAEPSGVVRVGVDPDFRAAQSELHTGAHVLNALVYRTFNGALITGAQLNDDLTARIDFDLPGVDSDRLRALDAELNDVIRQDLPVRYAWMALEAARAEPGLLRSRSVAPPPTADGSVRRHASGVHRAIPPAPHSQDRQQGPSQPPGPDRARRHAPVRSQPWPRRCSS